MRKLRVESREDKLRKGGKAEESGKRTEGRQWKKKQIGNVLLTVVLGGDSKWDEKGHVCPTL